MKLLVLSGGKGTRLSTVLKGRPKALAPIKDTTFMHYQISSWLKQELITEIVFLLGYKAREVIEHLQFLSKQLPINRVKFSYIVERYPLDTGGAVKNAVFKLGIKEPFFLANVDTWIDASFTDFLDLGTNIIGVVQKTTADRYETINIDKKMRVLSIRKRSLERGKKRSFVNAGIGYFCHYSFTKFSGEIFSLEKDFLPSLVAEQKLGAVILPCDFVDIGVPVDYFRFISMVENKNDLKKI